MTPQSTPATRAAKLPKSRVMWCDDDPDYPRDVRFQVHYSLADAKGSNGKSDLKSFPCAVIPCRTAKEARALVKLYAGGKQNPILATLPFNWVDPLLTGDKRALRGEPGDWDCNDIERLIAGIKERLVKALNLPTP